MIKFTNGTFAILENSGNADSRAVNGCLCDDSTDMDIITYMIPIRNHRSKILKTMKAGVSARRLSDLFSVHVSHIHNCKYKDRGLSRALRLVMRDMGAIQPTREDQKRVFAVKLEDEDWNLLKEIQGTMTNREFLEDMLMVYSAVVANLKKERNNERI